jgi:hypothetical protein
MLLAGVTNTFVSAAADTKFSAGIGDIVKTNTISVRDNVTVKILLDVILLFFSTERIFLILIINR